MQRCPRLGNPVPFDYCEICGDQQQPCFKILDCWWEHFDVVTYFQERLPPEAFADLQHPPPPDKISSLVEIIRRAKARTQQKSSDESNPG